ncbi:MAG: hypothetical protein ABSB35_30270 [Bryobacteraceae bacterium]|jgi:hypothetical protein
MVTLVYCLFVFGGGGQFFRDSDTGWHIRSGQWILAHRTLPRTDPYSFSKPGEPWFLWECGSDVLIALAHRVDGLRGVTALVAVAITACTWLWCRLNFAAGGDFFLAAALAPLMITTASLHWLARPHVSVGYPFLDSFFISNGPIRDSVSCNSPLSPESLPCGRTCMEASSWLP